MDGITNITTMTHRHFGSAPKPSRSCGLSEASSDAIIALQSPSEEHFGFSVFSSVTPYSLYRIIIINAERTNTFNMVCLLLGTRALAAHPPSMLPVAGRSNLQTG